MRSSGSSPASVSVLGIPVTVESLDGVAALVLEWALRDPRHRLPRYVCATSVHGIVEASHDPAFREILLGADVVTADGMPLVWVGRRSGHPRMTRVDGPTLMARVCRLSAGTGARHFFYGGAPGVADRLARRLEVEYPGLGVAGTLSPPFRALSAGELGDVADTINESRADIVWVGLGTPKQERWIAGIRGLLRTGVLLSVGAAFDYHAGLRRQAPRWIQNAGLGWLFRLLQEPRRLWRRYAYNNPMFVWLLVKQYFGVPIVGHGPATFKPE